VIEMHPDLEFFLERAFRSVGQTSLEIGRVVVEPDYDVAPDPKDAGHLTSELLQCLREAKVDKNALAAHEGYELEVRSAYRLLRKYIRRITLHGDEVQGDWVEVVPPGNWI
jgi:hypothetical protein